MQSKEHKDESDLKPHIKRFLIALALPIVVQIGALTPLFENSQFFAEDGWWKSLTGEEQIHFVLLGWAIWIGGVTVVALVLSFLSRRWQQSVWLPGIRGLRGAINWLGLLLVSRKERNRLVEREIQARAKRQAEAGPPKGRRSGLPGVVRYGPISTHLNMDDSSLRVEWTNNKQVFGMLVPSTGGSWEVQYGHFEGSVRPQFMVEEILGRVATAEEGVDQLRVRDLEELDAQQAESQLEVGNTSQNDGDL